MSLATKAAAVVVVFGALCAGAQAQDKNNCDQFKWSIARERGWFATGAKPAASGASVVAEQGYAVTLLPADAVKFRVAPERAPKAGSYGAALSVDIGKPGLYQITLSDEAWLDVVQGDAEVKSTTFSGQKDCPGVRKTVRFDLKAGPTVVQVSNATVQSINVALAPAQ